MQVILTSDICDKQRQRKDKKGNSALARDICDKEAP